MSHGGWLLALLLALPLAAAEGGGPQDADGADLTVDPLTRLATHICRDATRLTAEQLAQRHPIEAAAARKLCEALAGVALGVHYDRVGTNNQVWVLDSDGDPMWILRFEPVPGEAAGDDEAAGDSDAWRLVAVEYRGPTLN